MPLVKDRMEKTHKPPAHRHVHGHGSDGDEGPAYQHHHESEHSESWNKLLEGRAYDHTHPHDPKPDTVSWVSDTADKREFVDVDVDIPDCDSPLASMGLGGTEGACV